MIEDGPEAREVRGEGGAAMPVVTKDQALQLLTSEVKKFDTDELLEVYNELFPKHPYSEEKARQDPSPLVERLVAHINSGLDIGEIIELWGLIVPKHHHLWYDEVEDRIHYNEETEEVSWE